jgi:hypothetical protein
MTAAALRRLRGDSDFRRVLEWLGRSLGEQDRRNRAMADGAQLRVGQGVALTVADFIDHAEGKASAISAANTSRLAAERTP